MSQLYLDNDISDVVAQAVVELRATGLAAWDLDRIMLDEVYPVCHWNLRQVAGEWVGFDPDWLEAACAKAFQRPAWVKALGRPFRRRGLQRLVPEWPAILSDLKNAG